MNSSTKKFVTFLVIWYVAMLTLMLVINRASFSLRDWAYLFLGGAVPPPIVAFQMRRMWVSKSSLSQRQFSILITFLIIMGSILLLALSPLGLQLYLRLFF